MLMLRAFIVVALALAVSACRETGDVQVTSINFEGNTAINDAALKSVIATRDSSILPWSRKRFFDRPELDRDVSRIEAYYADRGYPKAKVVGVDAKLNDAKDKVEITVRINEGAPIIVENIAFEGFDVLPADHLELLRGRLPQVAGKPRDQALILASHDMVVARAARPRFSLRQHPHDRTAGVVGFLGSVGGGRRDRAQGSVRCDHDRRRRLGGRRGDPPRTGVQRRRALSTEPPHREPAAPLRARALPVRQYRAPPA